VTIAASLVTGAWNVAMNAVAPTQSGYSYAAIANIGGTYKAGASLSATSSLTCDPALGNQRIIPASSVGYATLTSQGVERQNAWWEFKSFPGGWPPCLLRCLRSSEVRSFSIRCMA
jgi:hypothetical protein